MGVIARQSIKGALANYLGIAIGFFTTFFVLTDCLSQEEIGLTRVMVDAAMLFSSLAQLGTNASIIRFFPQFRDDDRNHGIFGWSILLPFIGFLIFALCFFLFKGSIIHAFSDKSPLFVDYVYLLLPLTFFALYLTVFETNASVLLRITIPKVVREVGVRIFNLVCYILYGRGLISLDLFVVLFCSSYALAMLLNFFYLLSLGKISFRIDFQFLDRKLFREIMLYTLFMTMTALAGNIPLINSLFLGAKAGLALTGVYTIASFIANLVDVPYRSLGAISRPLISQAVKDENWQEVNRLGRKVSLHQFLVSSLLLFFIWINLDALFVVIPHGDEYVGGILVVLILGLARLVNSSLSIGTDILNFSKHYPLALIFIGILVASAILFNNVMIPLWGINGSAAASLCSYLLYFLLMLLFLGLTVKVNLFCWGQLKVLAMMALLFACHLLWRWLFPIAHMPMLRMLVDAGAQSLLLLAIAAFLTYRLHISPDVNRIMDNLLGKLRK